MYRRPGQRRGGSTFSSPLHNCSRRSQCAASAFFRSPIHISTFPHSTFPPRRHADDGAHRVIAFEGGAMRRLNLENSRFGRGFLLLCPGLGAYVGIPVAIIVRLRSFQRGCDRAIVTNSTSIFLWLRSFSLKRSGVSSIYKASKSSFFWCPFEPESHIPSVYARLLKNKFNNIDTVASKQNKYSAELQK